MNLVRVCSVFTVSACALMSAGLARHNLPVEIDDHRFGPRTYAHEPVHFDGLTVEGPFVSAYVRHSRLSGDTPTVKFSRTIGVSIRYGDDDGLVAYRLTREPVLLEMRSEDGRDFADPARETQTAKALVGRWYWPGERPRVTHRPFSFTRDASDGLPEQIERVAVEIELEYVTAVEEIEIPMAQNREFVELASGFSAAVVYSAPTDKGGHELSVRFRIEGDEQSRPFLGRVFALDAKGTVLASGLPRVTLETPEEQHGEILAWEISSREPVDDGIIRFALVHDTEIRRVVVEQTGVPIAGG